MKRFAALARVSSREQKREGFSLDVQEEGLNRFAHQNGGEIVKFAKVAETASDETAPQHFNELVDYAIKNASSLDGILFYKVDRAIRNTHDLCKLEELEHTHGVLVEFTSQPFPHSPAGWMNVRNLANFATFQTQQQSVDVREGLERRVRTGLFPQKAPYGYQNYRENSRSLVRIHPEHGRTVRRIFDLYAYHGHTIDSLLEQLERDGYRYIQSKPRFTRSKVAWILQDRSYIGEIFFHGDWWPGTHDHLIDSTTWDRVQAFRIKARYQPHDLLYGGELITCGFCGKSIHLLAQFIARHFRELITCGFCGKSITGEVIPKKLKCGGVRKHTYYRCARYSASDHPRTRLKQSDIDEQLLTSFHQLRIEDDEVRNWVVDVLRSRTQTEQRQATERVVELNKQVAELQRQQDELLNLRLLKDIQTDQFARKSRELRDRENRLAVEIESLSRNRHENADLAVRAFELSQDLVAKWNRADFEAKRRLLEILCLNLTLTDASIYPEWRKPFDMLAEGLLLEKCRADRI